MNGIFCSGNKANNNEEYKKVIKGRMTRMIFLFGVGCLTLAVSLFAKGNNQLSISDMMLGVYTGVGTGLMLAAFFLFVKNLFIIRDDEKLKNSRLENTDERIQDINVRATRIAALVLVFALYAVGLIGGLFYPVLINVTFGMVCLFLFSYLMAYRFYDKSTR
jgi:hypothetical protein